MRAHSGLVLPLIGASVLVLGVTGCTATGPLPERTTAAPVPSTHPSFGDRGSQQYAEGAVRRVGSEGFVYTVAEGDTAIGVAARFGTSVDGVSESSRGGQELFKGDEIRLGPPSSAAAAQ